jgi:hypothetical protein
LLRALLGLAACAPTATVSVAPTTTATYTPTVAPTFAVKPLTTSTASNCSSFAPEPVYPTPQLLFTLPPNTVWNEDGSAAGANMIIACTPKTTPDAITTFLNSELAQAGWRRWDPRTETAGACAHDNDFWLWSNGAEAVGWSYGSQYPFWNLAFCNLNYGPDAAPEPKGD